MFDSNGVSQAGFLGSKSKGSATGLQSIVNRQTKTAKHLGSILRKLGCDLSSAEVVKIFQEDSPAGNSVNFVAECAGFLVVAAPGDQMRAYEQNPPTDLILYVHRLTSSNVKPEDTVMGQECEDCQSDGDDTAKGDEFLKSVAYAYKVKDTPAGSGQASPEEMAGYESDYIDEEKSKMKISRENFWFSRNF